MKIHTTNQIFKLMLGLSVALGATKMAQAQNNTFVPGTSAITPTTQAIETGPLLDVVPYVLSDGYTINLTLIPSVTEFAGYQTPPNVANVTGGLNVVQLPVILPELQYSTGPHHGECLGWPDGHSGRAGYVLDPDREGQGAGGG